MRNTLTTLVTQLNRIEDIPALHTPPTAHPSVEVITHNLNHPGVVTLPRVKLSTVLREKEQLTNLPRYKSRNPDTHPDIPRYKPRYLDTSPEKIKLTNIRNFQDEVEIPTSILNFQNKPRNPDMNSDIPRYKPR